MKTREDVDNYLNSIKRWQDDKGDVADPGALHSELYEFKKTIDFHASEPKFLTTDSDKALQGDREKHEGSNATWAIEYEGLGFVYLHLYELWTPEHMGTWAEFWFEDEPWWNGDDPYECSEDQMNTIIKGLPDAHRARYLELASRSEALSVSLKEHMEELTRTDGSFQV